MLVRDHIALHHADLTPQLRVAADYVAQHPTEIATRSLRTIASQVKLSPPTFTRLAKALGFDGYEQLRELCRSDLKHQSNALAERAKNLQQRKDSSQEQHLLYQHSDAVIENINNLVSHIKLDKLEHITTTLSDARRVFLIGALSSASFAAFWGYISGMAFNHWHVVMEGGGDLASTMSNLDQQDVVIIISKEPYAKWPVLAAKEIHARPGRLIVLSDTVRCPCIQYADDYLVVTDESPQFFSSYVAMLVLIETLMGMVVAKAGDDTPKRIEDIVQNNYRLGQYWQE